MNRKQQKGLEKTWTAVINEILPVGVFRTDPEGKCLFVNRKWCAIAGMTARQAKGRGWEKAIHPEDLPQVAQGWYEAAKKNQVFRLEYRFRRPDGGVTWVLGEGMAIHDSSRKLVGYVGTITDITDRREHTQILEKVKAARQLSSMVSHELKTPLTAIREAVSLVREGIDGPVNEAQQKTLGHAHDGALRLERLINNLLHFFRIESGKMTLLWQETDINRLAHDVCDFLKPLAVKKGLETECALLDPPLKIRCDADKIRQVLINLIDNAIKATPEAGRVSLRLIQGPASVAIEVADTGNGIPREAQEKIFEMYTQIQADQPFGAAGFGIGLKVVREIVALHHGTIRLESEPGKGSCFRIELPIIDKQSG